MTINQDSDILSLLPWNYKPWNSIITKTLI
jgi:hypothetical protein